jgi:hypothetical protein
MVDSLDESNPTDAEVLSELKVVLGDFFAARVAEDGAWARTILGTTSPS